MDLYQTTFYALATVCTAMFLYFHNGFRFSSIDRTANLTLVPKFVKFQRVYLVVYLLMMAGDWLQGPYVYELYRSYGFGTSEIAILFIFGFLSSAVFGTVIGSLADSYGRKRFSLLFCVIYAVSCFTKLSPNFWILLFGRLLAGIATSLLYSVFESWMVCAHNNQSFPESWIDQTFSLATWGNGLVAILSGLVANFSADAFGFVAPFIVAAGIFFIGFIVIMSFWDENYGQSDNSASVGYFTSMKEGFIAIIQDSKILALGGIQSLFEGAMYCFVFIWTPTLQRSLTEEQMSKLPYGWIFACFMVAVMIGSMVFGELAKRSSAELICRPTYFAATIVFLIPVLTNDPYYTFLSFIGFETIVGMHWPLMGTLRSHYIPERSRSAVMNLVRIPLNLIVIFVLLEVADISVTTVFSICSVLLFFSFCLTFLLPSRSTNVPTVGSADK